MIEYEWLHLKKENRKHNKVQDILHPDFKEIGKSGKVYNKHDISHSKLDTDKYIIKDFEAQTLAKGCILCTYTLFNVSRNTITKRSSIWKYYEGDWKLLFHQGTEIR